MSSGNSSNSSNDVELGTLSSKQKARRSSSKFEVNTGEVITKTPAASKSVWGKFIDTFRKENVVEITSESDLESQRSNGAASTTHNNIKQRHVVMIAMAGGMGTGLLVGNGKALNNGGPLGLILSYLIVGAMLFNTMMAGGELAVTYSGLTGGFNAYPSKLVDRSLSFAVAWNYAINWLTVLPLEMVTASMTIKYWTTSVHPNVFVAICFLFVVSVNLFGARGYAEAEFWMNLCKVLMLVGFIILGMIIDAGKAGESGFIGTKFFANPGSFANGFKGVCAVLVTSTFSLGGTEFMVLTAADQKNPRKAIPSATKQVGYRLIFCYILSSIVIGLLVPYNSDQLMGSGQNNGAPVSPYVIAVRSHGIAVVPHIINAVILISVMSVGNAALYSSSRTFFSLSKQGLAPKWFDYTDRSGRPIRAMLISIAAGLFSFIAGYDDQESIFVWLLALSGLATIFTWSSICVAHIRFRKALKAQGRSTDELGYKSPLGIWGSYFALIVNLLILAAQFWVSLFPFNNGGKANVVNFFQNYLGMFSFLFLYVGHKLYTFIKKREEFIWFWYDAKDVDLDTHRKVFDVEILKQEKQEDRDTLKNGPFWRRLVSFLL